MVKTSSQCSVLENKYLRYVLITAGTLFLGLGIVGIFLPVLPTTPFLLLAAACYARSSQRFYDWLLNNKWFGTYVKNYREGRGVPLKVKIFTISLLWITILASIFIAISEWWIQLMLMIIAMGVTLHILTIKTFTQKRR